MRAMVTILLLVIAEPTLAAQFVIELEATGTPVGQPTPGRSPAAAPMVSVLTVSVSDRWIRIDRTGSGPGRRSFIVDIDTGNMTTLDHDRRIYDVSRASDFPTEIVRRSLEQSYGPVPDRRPVLKPTGRREVVSGFEADEYVVETPWMRITQWVAPSLEKYGRVFAEVLPASAGPAGALINLWMPDPAVLKGVPVRSVIHVMSSGHVTETTTRSIREATLQPSLFEIPADYASARPSRP